MAKVLWTQKQDIGPQRRAGHAIVYDTGRQRVTLFGGDLMNGILRRDTWEWDGDNWTQVQDIGPAARSSHAMAHDDARARTVLFGGRTPGGAAGDTWEWDGENWTQVADSGPASRSGHAMAFDSARQRVVLFGGESANGTLLSDTWEWDGTDWVQQEDTGPSPRRSAAMAFDPNRARTVLFGGADSGGNGLGDTWEWDGGAWTQEADFGPEACAGAGMAFKGSGIALYGGITSLAAGGTPTIFGLTWEWDGKHWTARQDMGPGPRVGHAMALDSARARIVLFGGLPVAPSDPNAGASVLGDTWEQLASAGGPGGPGGASVDIASLDIVPNPAQGGDTVTFTVNLVNPAPASANVDLFVQGEPSPFAFVPIPAGAMSGFVDLQLDPVAAPQVVPIIAVSGSSWAANTLTIQ